MKTFRDTLTDLRLDLTRHLAVLVVVISSTAAYVVLAQDYTQWRVIGLWLMVGALALVVYRLLPHYPQLARYAFVFGLNLIILVAMFSVPGIWTLFWALPLILVGSMLVTGSGFLVGLSLLAAVLLVGYDPLPLALGMVVFHMVLAWRAVETFYTALLWYSSMQQRADRLLQESREHRADLVQAVKSLDNAYKTQQRMQQELIRARKKAEESRQMKERFAANISHELRTPLNLIVGFSEVMYLSPEVYGDLVFPPKLRRDIYQIHRSSRHLLDMIDDILDLSQIEMSSFSIHQEPTNLGEFMHETAEIAEALFMGRAVAFRLEVEPELPIIDIDRTRIRQVLLNLLNNAQRFTKHGSVTLRVARRGAEVLFSVIDTGSGIPADKIEQVFEEFFQIDYSLSRSHGGAGLGLAITKRFVEAHHGTIWVESQVGAGSNFTFSLPITEYNSKRRTQELSIKTLPSILVIDEDPTTTHLLERHLDGYQVVHAAALGDLPALIADYHPSAVIHNVAPQHPETNIKIPVPYIACTLPSKAWMMGKLNVRGYLAKPIVAEQLIAEVRRIENVGQVLVVDDDRGFVQLIERILETSGNAYATHRAYDGEQALASLQAMPIDLILLDLAMPNMDGFALIDELQAHPTLASIPIILLTATSYIEHGGEQLGQLVVYQPSGLNPADVLGCIGAVIGTIKPRYYEKENNYA